MDSLLHPLTANPSHSVRPSLLDTLTQVKRQVEYDCFAQPYGRGLRIDPLFDDLCLIVAEVLVLNADSCIKINGNLLGTRLVQDIYLQLRCDHIRLVFNNFNKVSYPVRNKKSYLRTSLYNAAFELEADSTNIFRIDWPVLNHQ